MTVSQVISPDALRAYKLSKYANGQPGRLLLEAKKAKRVTSQFMSRRGAKEAAKKIKALKKTTKDTVDKVSKINKITDALKKGAFKEINGNWGTPLMLFLDAVQAGFTVFMVLKNAEMQALNIKTQEANAAGVQDAFTRAINNTAEIRGLQKQITAQDKTVKETKDLITVTNTIAEKGRKLANDALYETRKGREIVEGKVADARKLGNDALYEARQGRAKLETRIAETKQFIDGVSNNFKSRIEAIYQSTNNAIREANKANVSANKLSSDVSSVNSKIIKIGADVSSISTNLTTKISTAESIAKQALETAKNIPKIVSQNFTQQQPTITKIVGGIVSNTKTEIARSTDEKLNKEFDKYKKEFAENARMAQGDSKLQQQRFDQTVRDFEEAWTRQRTQVGKTFNDALKDIEAEREKLAEQVKQQQPSAPNIPSPELDRIQKENNQIKKDLQKIDTRLKEQEKVNESALPKLDSILGLIPAIPARTAGLINPNIPKPADIEKATGTAVCRSLNGGCAGKSLDDAVNNVKNHNNQNTDSLLNKLNAGAQIPELALLGIINNKLGDQLPGGIGGKLVRGFKWLTLDRTLHALTFAATVHNGFMLTSEIGQTLLSAFTNVLQYPFLKDDDDKPIDVGQIINSTVENFVKGIIGAENYQFISTTWAKANRIYQSSVNVLNAFQGLTSTTLNALEITAGRVGKIGNALRKSGEVLDNAYTWMNPQPKFNRVTNFLEGLQNGASTIQMVTQAPLDVINATTELTNASTEFVKSLKEDDKAENKGTNDDEPQQLKADLTASKLASFGKEIVEADLDADED